MSDIAIPVLGPKNTVSISATTSTASVALHGGNSSPTSNCGPVLVTNAGTGLAFVKFGTSAVTAAVTDTPVLPSQTLILDAATSTHAAAITGTGTATVYFTNLGN